MEKNDPMNMFRSAKKYKGIFTPEEDKSNKRKHEEADLHLAFCKWVKLKYPKAMFVRHEKEKHRTNFTGNLMKVYNSLDGLPDFECLEVSGELLIDVNFPAKAYEYSGLYIEFKKPGETWCKLDGYIKPRYQHQYLCHKHLWSIGRCAYFANTLDQAIWLFTSYMQGKPLPQQLYKVSPTF